MSNALKRRCPHPTDRAAEQKLKNTKLSNDCFMEVFCSMQLINFAVLYAPEEEGGFNFTKQKIQNFNEILRRHNQEYDDGGLISTLVESTHKKKFGFDCYVEANNFPYRPKMKMYGKKPKSMNEHTIALRSINGAIETYLILAVHTLHENYRFNRDMIWQWWNKFKEVAELYVKGMDDDFVIKYFKDECGLDVTK